MATEKADDDKKKKGTEVELFVPGTKALMAEVKEFCGTLGLPPEAASSVLRSAQSYRNLQEIVEKQKALSVEDRKALVDSKQALSSGGLRLVDTVVASLGLPYNVISLIQGKPYVKAEGLRLLVQADPRILKSFQTEKVRGEWHDANYIAEFRATLEFWGGGVFSATGSADLQEIQSRRDRSEAPPSFVDMIAETRAKRRAGREAVSLPVGISEDFEEGQENGKRGPNVKKVNADTGEIVEGEEGEQKEQSVNKPQNKGQLLAFAMSQYKLKKQDVEAIVALATITDQAGTEKAWDTIVAEMTKRMGSGIEEQHEIESGEESK